MKTYVQPGEVLEFTAVAPGAVSGTGQKIGDLLVIATITAATGQPFTGLRLGVVEHAKVSAQAWTEGQQINWDNATRLMTTVTTGNFRVGVAAKAAANPSATGFVVLAGVNLGAALP
jgi:predicted RecA/RadA family phage recombinase